jgi:hypothetical protein
MTPDRHGRGRVTIDILPDDVLLKSFTFYADETRWMDGWHTLVHVCRKWRNIVFGSPRLLNLQLVHTERTRMRKTLDVWPPRLPIVIKGDYYSKPGQDNLMATLEHNDRVCEIKLWFISNSLWRRVLAAMQVPFPTLTDLDLWFTDTPASVIPDSFLGGFAPRLRKLALKGASFLGLSKLLLSATDLVELTLRNIPHSGYISPEAMVACLSTLTRLEELDIKFESPQSRPDQESRRPRPTRTPLPSLTKFWFTGVTEYLEDFVARIDAPLLGFMAVEFLHQNLFDTPHLAQFIDRTPQLRAHDEARVLFSDEDVSVTLPGPFDQCLNLEISCRQLDLQVASLTQICSSSFPPALMRTVERLYVMHWLGDWTNDVENSLWLELLHPFTAVKDLYLSQKFVPRIAATLQDLVGEEAVKVLPTLERLFVEGLDPSSSDRKAFEPFLAARQLSGHPVDVSQWEGVDYWYVALYHFSYIP